MEDRPAKSPWMLFSFGRKNSISSTNESRIKNLLTEGESFFKQKKYQSALEKFKQILDFNPHHSIAKEKSFTCLQKLLDRHLNQQDYLSAEEDIQSMIRLRPEEDSLIQRLAHIRQTAYLSRCEFSINFDSPKEMCRIDNLIFQGGGIKGLAYLGALKILFQEYVDVRYVKRTGGASAGAITAALLALGYSLPELENLLKEVDFTDFMDGEHRETLLMLSEHKQEIAALAQKGIHTTRQLKAHFAKAKKGNILGSIQTSQHASKLKKLLKGPYSKELQECLRYLTEEELGLFPGDFFREQWAEKLIQAKTGIAYLTFAEHHEQFVQKKPQIFKDLYVVGLNVKTKKSEIFSFETTPNMIISDALRITMSIPILFQPHMKYEKINGKRTVDSNKNLYVDGGTLDNTPVWLFDQFKYLNPYCYDSVKKIQGIENPYSLIFRLVSETQKQSYLNSIAINSELPKNLADYVKRLAEIIFEKQESDHHKMDEKKRTIYIDHHNIPTEKFNLTVEEQKKLMINGEDAIKEQFTSLITFKHKETGSQETLFSLIEENELEVFNPEKYLNFDLNLPDKKNRYALDIAYAHQNVEMLVKLLQCGARVCENPREIEYFIKENLTNTSINLMGITPALSQLCSIQPQATIILKDDEKGKEKIEENETEDEEQEHKKLIFC